jgi:hypothetical protein
MKRTVLQLRVFLRGCRCFDGSQILVSAVLVNVNSAKRARGSPVGGNVDRKVGPRPRQYMQVKADRLRTGQSAGKARHGGLPDAGD